MIDRSQASKVQTYLRRLTFHSILADVTQIRDERYCALMRQAEGLGQS
jgi:hypothetical protein